MVYLEAFVVKRILKSFEKGDNKVSFEEAMKELGLYKEDGQLDKAALELIADEATRNVEEIFELVDGRVVDKYDKNSPLIAVVDTATLARPNLYHLLSFSKPNMVDVRKGRKKDKPETIVFTLMDFDIFYKIPDEEEIEFKMTFDGYHRSHKKLAKKFIKQVIDEIYYALNDGEYKEKFLALWLCYFADVLAADGSMVPFEKEHIDTHKLVDFED